MTAPAVAAKPLTGNRAQLDVLARQLLAQRSGLEAVIECVKAGNATAAESMAHALVDQLDAAFAVVNVLQLTADTAAAVESIETPAVDKGLEKPPVFGAKRKAAAAAAGGSTSSTGATDGNGRNEGPPLDRGDVVEGTRHDAGQHDDGGRGAGECATDRG